ncbi:MAG: hypothetical protein ACAH95_05900 [Fimbriimonas sp.]
MALPDELLPRLLFGCMLPASIYGLLQARNSVIALDAEGVRATDAFGRVRFLASWNELKWLQMRADPEAPAFHNYLLQTLKQELTIGTDYDGEAIADEIMKWSPMLQVSKSLDQRRERLRR